jgi:hypothetical protein
LTLPLIRHLPKHSTLPQSPEVLALHTIWHFTILIWLP